jgi:monoamine oxidase
MRTEAMSDENRTPMRRRELLSLIGAAAGGTTMYQAMNALGFAAESPYAGPIRLDGDPKGASVLVLGAGIAGLVAAIELRRAGYRVQVLESEARAGGRSRTIRGGDTIIEIDGATQRCEFDRDLYFNAGPWRIPYHHKAILDYCKRYGVALEPFIQVNHNAYVHAQGAFGGKPQRFRHVQADFNGYVAELLAKAANRNRLDDAVTAEDKGRLIEALQRWGALDQNYAYAKGEITSARRGYDKDPGGGLSAEPLYSQPIGLSDILKVGLWTTFGSRGEYDAQMTLFQPVGGMDMISRALARDLDGMIRFGSKVTAIRQDANGVTAAFEDVRQLGRNQTARADWCLCTIPLPILSRIPLNVGRPMQAAIASVRYTASVKVGLQFRRRFWEEDEAIYGGITYTDLPIRQISYPSAGLHGSGKGVLLGAYAGGFINEFIALSPADRVRRALEYGAIIHPQYLREFETGVSVAWSRMPSAQGAFGTWSEQALVEHYDNICAIDGRVLLAGDFASALPAWQEGAILSALDAITRLHRRVVAG